jgi:hypothetical protein
MNPERWAEGSGIRSGTIGLVIRVVSSGLRSAPVLTQTLQTLHERLV